MQIQVDQICRHGDVLWSCSVCNPWQKYRREILDMGLDQVPQCLHTQESVHCRCLRRFVRFCRECGLIREDS